jgi:phage shock protein PspC (stress-responsive transcriptional regulator)
MKKTVNINLAGTFFHIDEDAFAKLQRYLDAIKRSLSDPQGSDEILRDIEARIAELFSEKIENSSQVISIKELDSVIAVMGQPEDYMVDEEIFEDTPPSSRARSHASYKQLFRDIDNKFIAGVSSGLGHYLNIDAIWIRLIWVLLTVFSSGIFIVFYILFWILVPAAETTSEKLKMTGEPVNISNIEKKFKEGYEKVADSVKNADYDKYGKKVKSGATSFFEALGNILLTILKIFVKFIGIILIIVSLSTLIGLIIGLFTFGSVDLWGSGEFMDYFSMIDTTNSPLWLISLMTLFAVGIPFFVLFILGLKLLIDNLKTIGTTAKIILLILWVASLIGLGILGLRQATTRAYDGDFTTEETLPVRAGDTLRIAMGITNDYTYNTHPNDGLHITYGENDEKLIYSNDVRFVVRSTNDSIGKIILEKKAQGASFLEAKQWAEAIDYSYNYSNGTLTLDGYFTTELENKFRDQEIEIIVYLPLGSVLYAENDTYYYHRNYSRSGDILDNGSEEHYLLILQNKTQCLDCEKNEDTNIQKKNTPSPDWEEQLNRDLELVEPEEPTLPSEVNVNTVEIDSIPNNI